MGMAYFYALLASIFWGVGFIGSRYGLEEFGPLWLTNLRFVVASIAFLPVLKFCKKADFNKSILKGSFISAIFLTLLITLQIAGLEYTTVAKSGFITILYAFFTPVLCYMFYKKSISLGYWLLLSVAFFGMLMISEFNFNNLNYGDFLTLLCAVASAFHIISVSHYSKGQNIGAFNLLQLVFVALITLPLALISEGAPTSLFTGELFSNSFAMGGIIFMGIFSTSVAFFMQVKAQQKISAYIASLIFLLESPLAALLGYFAFNESMSTLAISGCAMVIISVGVMPFESLQDSALQKLFKSLRAIRFVSYRYLTMFRFLLILAAGSTLV